MAEEGCIELKGAFYGNQTYKKLTEASKRQAETVSAISSDLTA